MPEDIPNVKVRLVLFNHLALVPLPKFRPPPSQLGASKNRLKLKANRLRLRLGMRGIGNGGATGIFAGDERLKALSAAGDPL
jgi:hypothetical protein